MPSLTNLYNTLNITGELPENIWEEWLWRTDPEEKYSPQVLMNRCQLLGLLICLCKGMSIQSCGKTQSTDSRLTLMETPVGSMTLSELKDTVENLQVEWPAFLGRLPENPNAQRNLEAVVEMVDKCMARFGVLCSRSDTIEVMDDLASVDPSKDDPDRYQLTLPCIRRTVCTFLVLFRHLHLLAVAREVPNEWCDMGITKYHMEASNDDFHSLCMHLSLPVSAKLNYKHDFPEMYNHVSQAVFFHNSEYQRVQRASLDGLATAAPEHVLPALMQLYPIIGVRYEEDNIDLSEGASGEWFWLVVAGRIYLIDPERTVWYSPSITSLIKNVYLMRNQ